MPPQLPENIVVNLLRQCYTTPKCQTSRIHRHALPNSYTPALCTTHPHSRPRHRRVARFDAPPRCSSIHTSTSDGLHFPPTNNLRALNPEPTGTKLNGTVRSPAHIAVLGGGITGLASAHYLARENPNAQIVIYEGSERLGGWLKSQYIEVEGGEVLFESGPRTLRPNTAAALVALELIQELGLEEELLITQNTSVAHQNRYIYYPDHLVKLPGPGQDIFDMTWRVLTEPVFKGMAWGCMTEVYKPNRPTELDDESIGSWLSRRMGSEDPGNNVVSAALHGIYAGDIYQLSMKSVMPLFWHMEAWQGSIARSMLAKVSDKLDLVSKKDLDLKHELLPKIDASLLESLSRASVYSFREGIGAFSGALERSLKRNRNVRFKLGPEVTAVEYDGEGDGIKITTAGDGPPARYTKAISTISSRALSTITSNALPTLSKTHSVTVMVVNLYYLDPNILPERGFGYLIPRSIPFEQNPECALGVIFDSDAVQGQDTAPGTRVTVMLGGHWWDSFSSYPDEEEGANMARAVLHRHLKIQEKPAAIRVSLQKECIPQYTVGHDARMKEAHLDLLRVFKGKLAVAGNSYMGVGLNDCVRGARDVVMGMKRGDVSTGLEDAGRKDLFGQIRIPS